jgi:HemY protein
MAELELAEHGDGEAARAWLERAAEAPPDPLYVCSHCAAEFRDWEPLCPRCRSFDSLAWRAPPRAVALVDPAPWREAVPGSSGSTASVPGAAGATGAIPTITTATPIDAARRGG